MSIARMGITGLLIVLIGASAYLLAKRKPNPQARLHVEAKSEGFPEAWDTCPKLAISSEEAADYVLYATWNKERWFAGLQRKDGTGRKFENPDAAKVLRDACRTIEEDFPIWLSTERERLSVAMSRKLIQKHFDSFTTC